MKKSQKNHLLKLTAKKFNENFKNEDNINLLNLHYEFIKSNVSFSFS